MPSLREKVAFASRILAAHGPVLGDARAAFLVNHGIVTVGPRLEAATVGAVLLERGRRQQWVTATFGGWACWTGAEQARRKRQHMVSDQASSAVWDHLVRSLEGMT